MTDAACSAAPTRRLVPVVARAAVFGAVVAAAWGLWTSAAGAAEQTAGEPLPAPGPVPTPPADGVVAFDPETELAPPAADPLADPLAGLTDLLGAAVAPL